MLFDESEIPNQYYNKLIFILILSIMLNILLTLNFIKIKSSHNESTYNMFILTKESLLQINSLEEIRDKDGMKKFVNKLENIHTHVYMLSKQLEHSNIVNNENRDKFYTVIHNLSNDLAKFLRIHHARFANEENISPSQLKQYSQLKSELIYLANYFSKTTTSMYSRFGVRQYKIYYDKNSIKKLENLVSPISKIINNK